MIINNKEKKIIDYMLARGNEEFFLEVLDCCKPTGYKSLAARQAYYDYSDKNGIKSLIMVNKGCCWFADIRSEHYEWMKQLVVPELSDMFYILFREDIYKKFAADVGYQFRDVYHYHTMRLDKENFRPLLLTAEQQQHIIHPNYLDRMECRKLSLDDFNKIRFLQTNYLVEEVYGHGNSYPAEVEMKNLKRNLRNRIHYGLFVNGLAITKANVNGESPHLYQIGGVFTEPRVRGRHIAAHCLSMLLSECFKTKSSVSLYVKAENTSAIALYKHLGFRILFDTVMCYVN